MADEGLTLYGMVEEACNKYGDRQAVLYDNGEHQSVLSYRQLQNISCQVEKLFAGREKEVVGLCLQIDYRMPAILLGVLGCKAAFYNFDVKGFVYAMQVLKDIGAQVILIHRNFIQAIHHHIDAEEGVSTQLTVTGLEDYVLVKFTSIVRKKHVSSLVYCITTSGTTGKPKVVMVPNECIVPNISHLRQLFSLTADDLVLAATALTFDPSIVEMFMALSMGACLLIVPPALKMMPDRLLEMIHQRNEVTVIQVTPTLLSRFNASKLSQTILGDNSVMRVIALGGEKFPSCSWLQSMKSPSNKTGFYNLYGTTEVSCWATWYKVTEEDFRRSAEISLGHPLQNTVIEVRDDTGNIVTEGEGKLLIGGRKRQCIIDAREELNFDNLVLRDTGDIVRIQQDGSVYYVGRRDQQKKRNGQRINLEEIKLVGRKMASVHDCEVVLVRDQLVMFVVLSQQTMDTEKIGDDMKELLPSHWCPDSVICIANLPVTEHGKVDMKALENIYQERLVDHSRTDATEYLNSMWNDFTNSTTAIPETQNFILAGGNSLKAVRLVNTVENVFNVQLPQLVDIVLHNTYSDVRNYLISVMEQGSEQVETDKSERIKDTESVSDEMNKEGGIRDFEIHSDTRRELGERGKKFSTIEEKFMLKRKLFENQTVRKSKKALNDVQFSIRRCNRPDYINDTKAELVCGNTYKRRVAAISVTGNTNRSEGVQECNLKLEEVWKYDTGKCVDASPLLVVKSNGEYIVMIGSHSHRFSAISSATGESIWETTLPDRIESSACLSACGDFVVVGCYDGSVYCLQVDNGEIWWQFKTGSQVKCSPVVDTKTGLVYVGSHSQTVYCLDVNAQGVIWERHLQSGSLFSSPTISSDPHQLYVATLGGKMFALNPMNGEVLWEYNFQRPVFSSPTLTQQGVCVGCTDRCLYHFNYNGKLLWKFTTDGHIFSSPSVYEGNIFRTRNDGAHCFISYIREKSDTVHSRSIDDNGTADTFNSSESITFGSHDKCLYCVSSNGKLVWKLQVDAEVYSSPFQCRIGLTGDSHYLSCDLTNDICSKRSENQRAEGSVVKSIIDTIENSEEGFKYNQPKNSVGSRDTSCNCIFPQKERNIETTENQLGRYECSKCKPEMFSQSVFSKNSGASQSISNPALHVVVFASAVGSLYIVDVPTGNILCKRHLDGEIFSSPVVYNNTVVVGCRNDFVYCFEISRSRDKGR